MSAPRAQGSPYPPETLGLRPLLVLLGNTNDAQGQLSPMAQARVALAAQLWHQHPTLRILPTGAFGPNFNTTQEPHHFHITIALRVYGVPMSAILPGTDSTNTVEDARLSRSAVKRHQPSSLGVLTNAFHLARAQLIFEFVFRQENLWFIAAPNGVAGRFLDELEAHERQALHRLRTDRPLIED